MTLFTAFIVEDDGVVVWSGPELLREIDARKGATIGEKASAAKAPSSRWRNVSLSDPIHLLLFRFPTLGTGTDVAMESAGVTLLKGDLGGIVRARRLSQATMRNIRQNLFFAFIYNAAGIPIVAGVLYPTFGLLLSPIIAGAAMALSSVSVVGNALRLRSARL
jgi:hypothetical protein